MEPARYSAEPSTLELRYRRLLRVLPRAYRQAREQEMVDTFLDREFGADPDNADLTAKFGGVGGAETASVVALAIRLRWADSFGPQRYRIRVDAVAVALLAFLVMFAVDAVSSLGVRTWIAMWPPHFLGDTPPGGMSVRAPNSAWIWLSTWSFVLWLPVLALAVRHERAARWWALALAAIPAAVTTISAVAEPVISLSWTIEAGLELLVVVALATSAMAAASLGSGIGRAAMGIARHRGGWLVAAGAVALAIVTVQGIAWYGTSHGWQMRGVLGPIGWLVFDQNGPWCFAVIIVGVVLLVRHIRGRDVATSSLLGLAFFAGGVTLARAASGIEWYSALLHGGAVPLPLPALASLIVQTALVTVMTVAAAVLAARRIHRLPAVRYPPAGTEPAGSAGSAGSAGGRSLFGAPKRRFSTLQGPKR